MAKCVVLGGTGFMGSHLSEALLNSNHDVRVFGSMKTKNYGIGDVREKAEMVMGDFITGKGLKSALKGMDYVFHFISATKNMSSVHEPTFDINANVLASLRLFDIAVEEGVRKIIFASSGGTVYGEPESLPVSETAPTNPLSPYGISKLMIERYLEYYRRMHGLDYLILRYSNPYGERQDPLKRQGIISVFLDRVKRGEKPIIYGDGSTVKDYIYIKDAIEATLLPLDKSRHRIYNVGSGIGTSINELIEMLSEVTGETIEPLYGDVESVGVNRLVLDVSRIRDEFGWKPRVELRNGIKKTWEWICR